MRIFDWLCTPRCAKIRAVKIPQPARVPKWILTILAIISLDLTARANDWPQFRGPGRDGLSSETGLLKQWPTAGPSQLWVRHDVGSGFSAPAAVGDRLYLLANEGMESEYVRALSAVDGKTLWSTRIGRVGPNDAPPRPAARSTPTIVGDLIYALGSDGDLACLRRDDGSVKWTVSLRSQFNGRPGSWAYSESPLVERGRVIVTPGGAEATVVALDATTGRAHWTSAVPGGDRAAYSSWVSARVEDGAVYVQFVEGGLIGIDADSGAFLWRYDRLNTQRAKTATAVTLGSLVYTASAPISGVLLRLTRTPAGVSATEVYNRRGLPNAIGGSVLVNGVLYGTTVDGLVAADFESGAVKWRDMTSGPGSILYADGRLYVHYESGEVALVAASPDAYQELGRFTPVQRPVTPGDQAWVYPVLSHGRLYIREHGTLWAFNVREPARK